MFEMDGTGGGIGLQQLEQFEGAGIHLSVSLCGGIRMPHGCRQEQVCLRLPDELRLIRHRLVSDLDDLNFWDRTRGSGRGFWLAPEQTGCLN
jgi:hypothetical protein